MIFNFIIFFKLFRELFRKDSLNFNFIFSSPFYRLNAKRNTYKCIFQTSLFFCKYIVFKTWIRKVKTSA